MDQPDRTCLNLILFQHSILSLPSADKVFVFAVFDHDKERELKSHKLCFYEMRFVLVADRVVSFQSRDPGG